MGKMLAQIGHAPPPPLPDPVFFVGNGLYLHRLSTPPNLDGFHNFSCVCLNPHMYSAVATIKAANPNCKVLAYQTAPDMLDIGIGQAIPTWTQYRSSSWTTITWNEARVHDASFPSDKWMLTNGSGTTLVYSGFSNQYLGNFGRASFRNAWKAHLLERFTNEPNWDGIFMDNCIIQNNFVPTPPAAWPAELPSKAAWQSALKGFIVDAAGYVRNTLGKLVVINANYQVTGDGDNTSAVGVTGWWNDIGSGVVDVFFSEFAFQAHWIPANKGEGTTVADMWWQNWVPLIDVAENLGATAVMDCSLELVGNDTNSSHARYTRGSAFLNWDGVGLYAGYHYSGTATPYANSIAFPLGTPVGAKTLVNGCHIRQGTGGWVAVNPTSTQRTVSVGGTNRTIDSRDAYIGV